MSKGRDTATGAAQGAAIGTYFGGPGLGTAIGAGLGGLGGYFGIMPGSGGDEINKRRQEAIEKARALVSGAQTFGAQQANANLASLSQIFGPANDRLARLYGDGARVNIPQMGGPLGSLATAPPPPSTQSRRGTPLAPPPQPKNINYLRSSMAQYGMKPEDLVDMRGVSRGTPTRRG